MGIHWLGCVKVKMQIGEHHQRGLAGNSRVPGLRCKNSKDCEESELGANLEAMEWESGTLGKGSSSDARALYTRETGVQLPLETVLKTVLKRDKKSRLPRCRMLLVDSRGRIVRNLYWAVSYSALAVITKRIDNVA